MKKLALLLPLLALAAFAAHATELFVPDLFYARVPDRAAKEDLVSISVEAEAVEGPPGACALSVRSDEDDVRVVVEYAVAVSSGDEPCSVRLSCALAPEEFASVSPGLADLAGRPAPDAAARLRPLLAAADPRLGESLLLLEKTKALFLATLEAPPRHAMRDGNFVPLDPATNAPAASESHAEATEGAAETVSRRRAVVLDGTSRRWKREPGTTASQPPAWAAQSNVLANTFFCRLAPANRREGTENDFDIESWYFNGGSTNAAFRESLVLLLDDALVQGSTILDPDRAELVIRTISNETERVRGSHDRSGPWFAPSRPCRCRTGDRIDFCTDEFDVAVHVAQGRVPDALDLVFRRNASAAPSLLDFPGTRDPDAETTFSLFSGSTICLVAPSRIEGGVPALLLLRVTMLPATQSPADESHAESAKTAE